MREILKVEGMTCQHCVQTVSEAIGKLAGVQSVAVDLDQKSVTIDFDEAQTNVDAVSDKVVEAGFEVIAE